MEAIQEGLSVVVTNYNNEKFIAKCLDSICNQTYSNMEIIVVDDGSTDNSLEIIQKFAKADSRIKVVKTEHKGAAHARKAGMRVAKKEYISFPDGDDWIEANMYERMMQLAKVHNVDVVCDNCLYIEKGECTEIVGENDFLGKYEDDKLDSLKENMFILSPSLALKVFKRNILWDCIESVPEDVKIGNDLCACFGALVRVNSVYVINEPMYHYRIGHRPSSKRGPFILIYSYSLSYNILWEQFKRFSVSTKSMDGYISGKVDDLMGKIYLLKDMRKCAKQKAIVEMVKKMEFDMVQYQYLSLFREKKYLKLFIKNRISPILSSK